MKGKSPLLFSEKKVGTLAKKGWKSGVGGEKSIHEVLNFQNMEYGCVEN